MGIFEAIVYGIVQGLTEFLPVSSSAHLLLLPVFTGWPDPGLAFDVALHWGTLLAVTGYFWKDLAVCIRGFFGSLAGKREFENIFPWRVIAATIPGVVAGLLLEDTAETVLRSPWIPAATLAGVGVILWIADKKASHVKSFEDIDLRMAFLIGLAQAVALVPGVSRSGITIATGLFLGLQRPAAVRFSFFMSIPIIMGAGVLKAEYLFKNAGDPALWAGLAASAVAGLAAIHILISYVRTRTFLPFVIYRIALSLVIVAWLLKA